MKYIVNGKTYSVSYRRLKDQYLELVEASDVDFMNRIHEALHLACIISWFKELGIEDTVGDEGAVHRLIHLIDGSETDIKSVRETFNETLKLV